MSNERIEHLPGLALILPHPTSCRAFKIAEFHSHLQKDFHLVIDNCI